MLNPAVREVGEVRGQLSGRHGKNIMANRPILRAVWLETATSYHRKNMVVFPDGNTDRDAPMQDLWAL